MDHEWQLRWVRVPEGTHLSKSRATPGAQRDLLRADGTNSNLGPTESMPAYEEELYGDHSRATNSRSGSGRAELSSGQRFAASLVEEMVAAIDWDAVYEIAAPAISRKARSLGKRLRAAIGRDGSRAETEIATRPLGSSAGSSEHGVRTDAPTFGMTSAEYQGRLIAALAADAYAAQQRAILAHARVEDRDVPPELTSAVKLVLEGKISLLDDDALAVVMKFLDAAQAADCAYAIAKGEDGRESAIPPTE